MKLNEYLEIILKSDMFLGKSANRTLSGDVYEIGLRSVLRERMKSGSRVGYGIVYDAIKNTKSLEMDVIIYHNEPLFEIGELVAVSPDSVSAVIQIKSALQKNDIADIVDNLKSATRLSSNIKAYGLMGFVSSEDALKRMSDKMRNAGLNGLFGIFATNKWKPIENELGINIFLDELTAVVSCGSQYLR
jgi:hypothetical protein